VPRKLELTGLLFCFGTVPLAIAIQTVRQMRVAVVFILKNVTMKLKRRNLCVSVKCEAINNYQFEFFIIAINCGILWETVA
jgi:hypothetical protein